MSTAEQILRGLGGAANVVDLEPCHSGAAIQVIVRRYADNLDADTKGPR